MAAYLRPFAATHKARQPVRCTGEISTRRGTLASWRLMRPLRIILAAPDASFAHRGMRPQRTSDRSRRGSLGCWRMMGTGWWEQYCTEASSPRLRRRCRSVPRLSAFSVIIGNARTWGDYGRSDERRFIATSITASTPGPGSGSAVGLEGAGRQGGNRGTPVRKNRERPAG
jgi:hypothetical protein